MIRRLAKKMRSAYGLLRYPFIYARLCRRPGDPLRALILRAAATRAGRRILPQQRWTLAMRAAPDEIVVRLATSDFMVAREIFQFDEYGEVRNWRFAPEPTIIDLGGNIGLASLYFGLTFPRARLIAVEPDRGNCDILRINCRSLIESGRLTIREAFVDAQNGVAAVDRSGDCWTFKKAPASSAGEAVECVSMSSLIQQNDIGQIDLVKCDIEGSEAELFRGCASWIGRVGHLIVETHIPYSPKSLYEDLRAAGWAFEIVREEFRGECSLSFLKRNAQ